jgi:putative transcriptional regulator
MISYKNVKIILTFYQKSLINTKVFIRSSINFGLIKFIYHKMRYFNLLLTINFPFMNRIKTVLAEKKIKQTWLASELGKSYNMVNGYVSNRRQPSIEVLYQIAKLLQVDAKDLLV